MIKSILCPQASKAKERRVSSPVPVGVASNSAKLAKPAKQSIHKVYMVVTVDPYELPVALFDRLIDCAAWLSMKSNALSMAICRQTCVSTYCGHCHVEVIEYED